METVHKIIFMKLKGLKILTSAFVSATDECRVKIVDFLRFLQIILMYLYLSIECHFLRFLTLYPAPEAQITRPPASGEPLAPGFNSAVVEKKANFFTIDLDQCTWK